MSNADSVSGVVQSLNSIIEPLKDSPKYVFSSGPPIVIELPLPVHAALYDSDTAPAEPLTANVAVDSKDILLLPASYFLVYKL